MKIEDFAFILGVIFILSAPLWASLFLQPAF